MTTTAERLNEALTARLVAQLEAGVVPWRKPWSASMQWPENAVTGHRYRGINVLLLAMLGYELPRFVTFRQAAELGGHVRKGEHGVPIVFWRPGTKGRRDDEVAADGDGERPPLLRLYTVFHVGQCEDLPPALAEPPLPTPPPTVAELLARVPSLPRIEHGHVHAAYSPRLDTIVMPYPDRFASLDKYHLTLFHELVHATGHPSRLGRFDLSTTLAPFGSEDYSAEELVAELGASFLLAATGLQTAEHEAASASYLASWLKVLAADPSRLRQAATAAQAAFDYLVPAVSTEASLPEELAA